MIRKFNYTGRKKIKRSHVGIDILRDSDGRRFFNYRLQLDEMALPENAHIYVEAYHRTAYQRFDCGTVGRRRIPPVRRLDAFSEQTVPLFRVKVVDRSGAHGKILASLDRIRPERVDAIPAGGHSLLFVEYEDLGQTVWMLDLDGNWPVLRLNRRAEDISLVASSDSRFLALVYPEVLRRILTRVLIEDEHSDPDCDDDWPSLWLKLACTLPGMTPPPPVGRSDQEAWIDRAVETFSANHNLLDLFNQSVQEAK